MIMPEFEIRGRGRGLDRLYGVQRPRALLE